MLKKVIEIKNVARFRNSAAPGNPKLAKRKFYLSGRVRGS